jgi:hypothetical protein
MRETQLRLWDVGGLATNPCPLQAQLEEKYRPLISERPELAERVSYRANKELPLLRLYRYKEAFAFTLVQEILQSHKESHSLQVLDPFCGMGTTLFVSSLAGVPAWGVDRLPVGVFVANTLTQLLCMEPGVLSEAYEWLAPQVNQLAEAPVAADVAIMKVAFDPAVLSELRRWKTAILQLTSPVQEVMLLLFLSILEPCSYTSKDGQFLRLRREKIPANPTELLRERVRMAEQDIERARVLGWRLQSPAVALLGDARMLPESPFEGQPNLVITSPPYVNRYDYTRSYSLELCFAFVKNFEELRSLRHSVLRSHIEARVEPEEQPPHPIVQEVVNRLRERRTLLNNPRIPDMVTGYFVDMKRVISELSRVLAEDAHVYMVVDNVRFDGEMLPVDLILCDMAEQAGFETEAIWVARYKGNSSQQMGRYGRVPVRESVLVWRKGNARSAYHPTPVRPHQQYCCRISDSIDRIADLIDGIANPIDKIADPDDGIADPIDSTADPIDGIANPIDRIGNPDGVCKGVVPA